MRRARRLHNGDEGITLIIAALSLIVLMVFAAFAIDVGALFNERRQDQAAADSGALGGLHEMITDDGDVADSVIALVQSTIDTTIPATAWNTCTTGPNAFPEDSDNVDIPIGGYDCITSNFQRTRLQVKLPKMDYDTNFGAIVGIDSLQHSAFAVAEIASIGFGDILPYGIALGAGVDGGHICVRAGPGGIDIPPCTGPDSGNFGIIDLGIWDLGDCDPTPAAAKDRQDDTTAVGLDHILSRYGSVPWNTTEVTDTPNCGAFARPNAAFVGPGNSHNETGSGLWSGSGFGFDNNTPARLRQTHDELFNGSGVEVAFTNGATTYNLDDNPLWEFIAPTFTTADEVPDSCHKSVFTNWLAGNKTSAVPNVVTRTYLERDHTDLNEQMRLLMERCMFHYQGFAWQGNGQRLDGTRSTDPLDKPYADLALAAASEAAAGCSAYPCTDPVFTRNSSTDDEPDLWDVQYTPRFGYVPVLWSSFPTGNSGTVRFKAFRPVFIQRVCMGQNSCGIEFEPGLPGSGGAISGTSTSSFTAYLFPLGMLPGELDDPDAAFKIGLNQVVRLVR